MYITMEKYHGFGSDYFIWDPKKNGIELDSKKAKAIYKSNLGMGAKGIICGPIYEEDYISLRIFSPDGTELQPCQNSIRIFLEYLKEEKYLVQTSKEKLKIKEIPYEDSCNNRINNSGFVILGNQFAEELQVI